jgi:hypothetical protein
LISSAQMPSQESTSSRWVRGDFECGMLIIPYARKGEASQEHRKYHCLHRLSTSTPGAHSSVRRYPRKWFKRLPCEVRIRARPSGGRK